MGGQRYTSPVALARLAAGNCPECGSSEREHVGGGPAGCGLTDLGVAQRIYQYEKDRAAAGEAPPG